MVCVSLRHASSRVKTPSKPSNSLGLVLTDQRRSSEAHCGDCLPGLGLQAGLLSNLGGTDSCLRPVGTSEAILPKAERVLKVSPLSLGY